MMNEVEYLLRSRWSAGEFQQFEKDDRGDVKESGFWQGLERCSMPEVK